MGMHGYLQQVPAARLEELIADPDLVHDELYADDRSSNPRCTTEKTWNAIQFVLQVLSDLEHFPADSPILDSGITLGDDLSYGPADYRTPDEVAVISSALNKVTEEMLRDAYRPELMTEHNVYPETWDREDQREWNFGWIQGYFQEMTDYYADATSKGNAIFEYLG